MLLKLDHTQIISFDVYEEKNEENHQITDKKTHRNKISYSLPGTCIVIDHLFFLYTYMYVCVHVISCYMFSSSPFPNTTVINLFI